MKKVLYTMFFLFTITLSFAQPVANKITVIVKEGKFTINKDNVTNGWKKDDAIAALGLKGDRQRVKANTTHTYDDYGMVLFEKNENQKGTGILSEIQFYTGVNDSNSVRPAKLFTGKMEIEGLKISGNLSWSNVKTQLVGFENFIKQTESYMEHSYRLSYKGIYFYFFFNNDETALLKVSIGKDERAAE